MVRVLITMAISFTCVLKQILSIIHFVFKVRYTCTSYLDFIASYSNPGLYFKVLVSHQSVQADLSSTNKVTPYHAAIQKKLENMSSNRSQKINQRVFFSKNEARSSKFVSICGKLVMNYKPNMPSHW